MGLLSLAEEHRAKAQEATERAYQATNVEDRASWLRIAVGFRELAHGSLGGPTEDISE
jgi:hypothetical protein